MQVFNDWTDRWWLDAIVSRADTHVYWSASSVIEFGAGGGCEEVFVSDVTTSLDVFLDLMERSVINGVRRADGAEPFFHEAVWEQISDYRRGRDTSEDLHFSEKPWYQLNVDGVSDTTVSFDFTVYGYKYKWSGLQLPTPVYYKLAERLDARVRFQTDWSAMDVVVSTLRSISDMAVLTGYASRVRESADRLRGASPEAHESVARDLLTCLEGFLRTETERRAWKGKTDNLPNLIQTVCRNTKVRSEDAELMKFSKPVRDYLGHGHRPGGTMAKSAVVIAAEALSRAAVLLQNADRLD